MTILPKVTLTRFVQTYKFIIKIVLLGKPHYIKLIKARQLGPYKATHPLIWNAGITLIKPLSKKISIYKFRATPIRQLAGKICPEKSVLKS